MPDKKKSFSLSLVATRHPYYDKKVAGVQNMSQRSLEERIFKKEEGVSKLTHPVYISRVSILR